MEVVGGLAAIVAPKAAVMSCGLGAAGAAVTSDSVHALLSDVITSSAPSYETQALTDVVTSGAPNYETQAAIDELPKLIDKHFPLMDGREIKELLATAKKAVVEVRQSLLTHGATPHAGNAAAGAAAGVGAPVASSSAVAPGAALLLGPPAAVAVAPPPSSARAGGTEDDAAEDAAEEDAAEEEDAAKEDDVVAAPAVPVFYGAAAEWPRLPDDADAGAGEAAAAKEAPRAGPLGGAGPELETGAGALRAALAAVGLLGLAEAAAGSLSCDDRRHRRCCNNSLFAAA